MRLEQNPASEDSDRGRLVGSAKVTTTPENDGFLENMKLRLGQCQQVIPVCNFLVECPLRLIALG
jgi:hypothetical protein